MSSLTQCHQTPTALESRATFRATNSLARVVEVLKRIMDFLERGAAGRRALRQLADADDRMLKDIGLDRSDLRNAAAEPFYRDPTELLAGRVDEGRTHQPHHPHPGRDAPSRYY